MKYLILLKIVVYLALAILGLLLISTAIDAFYSGMGSIIFYISVPIAVSLVLYLTFKPDKELHNNSVHTEAATFREESIDTSTYDISKKLRQKYRFLCQDETYVIHGYSIDGLIYIGTTSDQAFEEEPSIVDPKLPVKNSDLLEPLGYWPNYASINAGQRGRYLKWLSGDRGFTEELGYVFLYLYGFERYVLRDAILDSEDLRNTNLVNIVAELQRLNKLFHHSSSFCGYSAQLIDVIYILHWPERIDARKAVFPNTTPLAAKFAIAQMANLKPAVPLDSDWALQWLIGFGHVSKTKTVREQYPILRSLFKAVYLTATNGGLKVPTCKTKLNMVITPASRGLDDFCSLNVPDDWCDPTGLKNPITTLLAINDEVLPALRILAKSVYKKDIAGIMSAWPSGVPMDSVPKLKKIADRAISYLDKNAHSDLFTLGKLFGVNIDNKATKFQLKQIASALDTCGFTMVPDPLVSPSNLKAADLVIIYKGSRLVTLSPEGQWVSLSVQIGSLLVLTEGDVHTHEMALLVKLISAHPNSEERVYLSHYLNWRLDHHSGTSTAGIKRQISLLSEAQRRKLAKMLIDLALSDGLLSTSEIKKLEKLFGQLGFTASLVAELLHSSPASSNLFLPAVEQPSNNPEFDIELNAETLQAHSESTKEIQAVLHQIFNEASLEDESESPEVVPKSDSWHKGQLDDDHDQLAIWLLTRDVWPIDEINSKCQELGLLADGALEAINNVAFDIFGDGLLEIGNPVEIYRDVFDSVNV